MHALLKNLFYDLFYFVIFVNNEKKKIICHDFLEVWKCDYIIKSIIKSTLSLNYNKRDRKQHSHVQNTALFGY